MKPGKVTKRRQAALAGLGPPGPCQFVLEEPAFVCGRRTVERHHILPRSAGGNEDADNLITLCRRHHRWVHEHPADARKRGLLKGRYKT